MFLYPLTISLILLALFGKFFNFDRKVFMATTTFNLVAAFIDFAIALPPEITDPAKVEMLRDFASKYFPLFNLGLGWVIPTLFGLIVGLVWREIGYKTVK
jgi:LIVCS family branched-chain amino acid:cation transporter